MKPTRALVGLISAGLLFCKEKTVMVLLKENENIISGVTVLSADTEEFVFVNVMGTLSAKALTQISDKFSDGHALDVVATSIE